MLKPVVFTTALVPLGFLVWGAFNDALGANPVETITFETGQWGLRFLLVTLTVTPLRRITGWSGVVRIRRMLGLFGFFYICLHSRRIYGWISTSALPTSSTTSWKDLISRSASLVS